MSLSDFAKRMDVIAKQVGDAGPSIVRQLGNHILEELVPATPIKSGKARVNWLVGSGSDPTNTIGPPAQPSDATAEALSAGRAVIAAHRGGDLYIANNLEYINKLDNGSSAQAPSNFVQTAVQKASSKLASQVIIK